MEICYTGGKFGQIGGKFGLSGPAPSPPSPTNKGNLSEPSMEHSFLPFNSGFSKFEVLLMFALVMERQCFPDASWEKG